LSALLLLSNPSAAAPTTTADTGTDPSIVIDKYIQHYVVQPDGSYRLTVDNVKTIVLPHAVQAHSQYVISYNTRLDELSEVEAYTVKPDGRRIAAPPELIKDQPDPASRDAPMFQDARLKIIAFSDVAAGDQVAVRYVLKRKSALFPGHFEDLSSSQFYASKQFHLIYDMPASMTLYADAAGFAPVPAASASGRQVYQWKYVGGPNRRIESDAVSYLDYGKRLAVSTFPNYAAFARAYHARAKDQAAATPAIDALAREVTAGLDAPRAKALALSEWVRHNIGYVAVPVGAGGVVPHAAATVLENRYGDCKDHAILLEALLAAAGIESSAALVNAGNAYRLPDAPTLGIFNHVITYIPALELYLDASSDSVEAGYLPSALLGKPVLLASSGQLAQTPFLQPEANRMLARVDVGRNGRASLNVVRTASGALAEAYRQAVRDTAPAERALFVERMLQALGQHGDGSFDVGLLDAAGEQYRMGFAGVSDNFAGLPGPAFVATSFNFWGGTSESVEAMAEEKTRTQDFICPALDAADETVITFAPGIRILALPKALSVNEAGLSYQAAYSRQANRVLVTRSLRFRHAGRTCTPADYLRMRAPLERMLRDLRSRIVVKAG
jgi:transglutaminase-like putative cysteine protease